MAEQVRVTIQNIELIGFRAEISSMDFSRAIIRAELRAGKYLSLLTDSAERGGAVAGDGKTAQVPLGV